MEMPKKQRTTSELQAMPSKVSLTRAREVVQNWEREFTSHEDLIVHIARALDEVGAASVKQSRKDRIANELRASDLTAQYAERDDIEYGHHDSLPRGEHVARMKQPPTSGT